MHGANATKYYASSLTVSSGSLTFNLTNVSGSEIDAGSGVHDRAIQVAVRYSISAQ
jgi:hypothetical protein